MTPRSRSLRVVVAAALAMFTWAGCANYIGTTAASYLRRVRQDPNPNIRHQAYKSLASPNCYDNEAQKAEAARVLAEVLSKRGEPIAARAEICRTLGALGRPEGREAVCQAVEDDEDLIRAEACRALGRVGKPEDAALLSRIMAADSNIDCRIAAIEGIAALKSPDARLDVMLVEGMKDDDPAIRVASYQALREISGQDLGVDPEPWVKYAQERLAAQRKTDPADAEIAAGAPAETR